MFIKKMELVTSSTIVQKRAYLLEANATTRGMTNAVTKRHLKNKF